VATRTSASCGCVARIRIAHRSRRGSSRSPENQEVPVRVADRSGLFCGPRG
jgi:hypothetical protein